MARGGSGGDSRMQQMAQQRDAMAQKLIDAIEVLSKSFIDQSKSSSGGQSGGAAMPGSAAMAAKLPAMPGQSPAAGMGDFWGTGKADNAPGSLAGPIRSMLSAGGLGQMASVVGAIGTGPAGVAAAGAGAIVSQAMTPVGYFQQQTEHVRQAYLGGSTRDSEIMRRQRATFARIENRLNDEEAEETPGGDPVAAGRRARARDMRRAENRAAREDLFKPQEDAMEETVRMFTPMARAGGLKTDEGKKAFFQFYDMVKGMAEDGQDAEKLSRMRDTRMQSGSQGVHGGLQGH